MRHGNFNVLVGPPLVGAPSFPDRTASGEQRPYMGVRKSRHPWRPNSLSIGFISLGCPKNLVDSESIAFDVSRHGFVLARTPETADILIINTCAFIEDAKKESIAAILAACDWKKKAEPRLVIVAGCLPQRYPGELQQLLPDVDAFIGVDQVRKAPAIIRKVLNGGRGIMAVSRRPRKVINPSLDRILFTDAPYAYIKIAEGCDHRCSFCAIPQIRGRFRSRPPANIIAECEALLHRGVRELNLIAQDVTYYGHDLPAPAGLPALLRQIGRIGGKFWIRLLYGHPAHVSEDLLAALGETPQACHYLDLPIQHCDEKILRLMRRPGNPQSLCALFSKIRKAIPDIALRTTCLVGFPGETDLQFRRLVRFSAEIGFDHLGVFVYSDEEGVASASLAGKISRRLARQRKDILMRAQQKIVARKLAEAIGKTGELFVEKRKDNAQHIWIARSQYQAPGIDSAVYLSNYAADCAPGMFVQAKYIKAKGYDLIAEPIDNRN